jgi:hypothetical protein
MRRIVRTKFVLIQARAIAYVALWLRAEEKRMEFAIVRATGLEFVVALEIAKALGSVCCLGL